MSNATRTPDARPDAKLDTRKDEWTQATEKGKEAVESMGSMASHAGAAVGTMASDVACDVGRKADNLVANAGSGMKEMGDRISRNGPQGGMLGNASHTVGQSVHDGGQYLEHARLSGVSKDIAQLVRQNPLPAVCIALGLGWLLARKMRN